MLDLLVQLIDKSLVQVEARAGETRYRLLETTREYAHERLRESGEEASIRARHRDYFLRLAEETGPKLFGAGEAVWLDLLEAEYDNLRAAHHWCFVEENGVEPALRLGAALSRFWDIRGYYREAREQLEAALAPAAGSGPTPARADALNAAGLIAFRQGDNAAAQGFYAEELGLRRMLGDRRGEAGALLGAGITALGLGDYAEARAALDGALSVARQSGDRSVEARSLVDLALVAKDHGRHEEAWSQLEQALSVSREIGNSALEGMILHNLGNIAQELNDLDAARPFYEQSLEIHRRLGSRTWEGLNLYELAATAVYQRRDEVAEPLLNTSLAIAGEVGDRTTEALCLYFLGMLARRRGELDAARTLSGHAAVRLLDAGINRNIIFVLEELAGLHEAEGKPKRAAQLLGAAEALRESLRHPVRPLDRAEYDRRLASVQRALSSEEFAAEWAEGRAMTAERAIGVALKEERCRHPHGAEPDNASRGLP